MSNVSAINVSNYFTNKAIKKEKPLTLMQALKLTYIAQGFHLSLLEKPFFDEEIEAWKYGPVVKILYEHLSGIRDGNYMIKDEQPCKYGFREKQLNILNVVFSKYARLGAWDLSELTHQKDTPWDITYRKKPDSVIKLDLVKEHFKKIITPYSFAILLDEVRPEKIS